MSGLISRKRVLAAVAATVMGTFVLAFNGPAPVAAPPAPPTKMALAAARSTDTPAPIASIADIRAFANTRASAAQPNANRRCAYAHAERGADAYAAPGR